MKDTNSITNSQKKMSAIHWINISRARPGALLINSNPNDKNYYNEKCFIVHIVFSAAFLHNLLKKLGFLLKLCTK
jgi:hypothetical protein